MGRVGLSSICISCSFCGGVAGRAGAVLPNEKDGLLSPFWLVLEGPPNRVVGAEAAGVDGPPNVKAGLLSAGVFTGGVAGAPNENGDFAGVAGDTAEGADEPKENPLLGPDEVEGNSGFGASIVAAGVEGDGVGCPKVNGFGVSLDALAWLPPKGDGEDTGAPNNGFGASAAPNWDVFNGSGAPNRGLVSIGLEASVLD